MTVFRDPLPVVIQCTRKLPAFNGSRTNEQFKDKWIHSPVTEHVQTFHILWNTPLSLSSILHVHYPPRRLPSMPSSIIQSSPTTAKRPLHISVRIFNSSVLIVSQSEFRDSSLHLVHESLDSPEENKSIRTATPPPTQVKPLNQRPPVKVLPSPLPILF